VTDTARVFELDTDLEAGLAEAAAAVANGECVVLPTDTVYGIGANAFDRAAVQRLLDAKERGRDMPPPVLIAEPSMLRAVGDDVPDAAKALAQAFWPGALTLILKAQSKSGMELGETRGTVAVRVPDHDGARALLRRTGPLAVSSANVSGQPPATTAADALDQLGDRVSVYLDGGTAPGGVALRDGALSLEQLRAHAPTVAPKVEPEPAPEAEAEPEAAAIEADPEPEATAIEAVAEESTEPVPPADEQPAP
jgi:tRNA threonylcarbamoyl adenosine modification protein (Sua5/YciO/YrdC/YwlC family)